MNLISLLVEIKSAGDSRILTVDAGALGAVESDSPYQLELTGRIADVVQRIDAGRCNLDNLRDVGTELFDSIFSSKRTLDLFEKLRASASGDEIAVLRLCLPTDLQQLPWEALYKEGYPGFAGTHPNYCVARELFGDTGSDGNVLVKQLPLTILVVTPVGSGLNIEQEWHNIQQVCEEYPGSLEAERLGGRVTPKLLSDRLDRKAYNIVHFIGHGEVTGSDEFKIRLNDPGDLEELWMEAETFANLYRRHPPQLVILNCCLGAAASPKRTLTGIAPALLRSGVSAVVAMRYEIPDQIAADFTGSFYRELLGGRNPGRVDAAVSCARQLIYSNKRDGTVRGFITPVLYLKRGREHLFQLPGTRVIEVEGPQGPGVTEEIPEDLAMCIEKLQLRDCVAVIGPGILSSSDLTRSAKQPPSLRELAVRLATECGYPWASEFSIEKSTEDWLTGLLLPWVCQHYQRVKRRYELIRSISSAYNGVDTPALFRALTRLAIPGIVYTHFDGLFEKAFLERNMPVQTISAVDQRFESDIGGTVLICPKGMLRLKDSLVLTEEDHEQLYDRIAQWWPVLRDRMRGQVGRSALFIGVSPRDELIRRIAGQLLEAGETRTQGPTFFICNYHSTGDDAYWSKYDVRWIAYDTNQLTNLIRRIQ